MSLSFGISYLYLEYLSRYFINVVQDPDGEYLDLTSTKVLLPLIRYKIKLIEKFSFPMKLLFT